MNIEITTEEYRDLLDILHIADVIMSGHRRVEDQRSTRHHALIQKLYGQVRGEALDQLISYDKNTNTYMPTVAYEENTLVHVFIDEFGDHLFWDELISRLSVRDAARNAGGIDRLNAMIDDARQALEGPIRKRYIEEFSANGLDNVAVIERFDTRGGIPVRTSD